MKQSMSLSIRAWVWLASPGVACTLRVQGQFKHGNTVIVLILSSPQKASHTQESSWRCSEVAPMLGRGGVTHGRLPLH